MLKSNNPKPKSSFLLIEEKESEQPIVNRVSCLLGWGLLQIYHLRY